MNILPVVTKAAPYAKKLGPIVFGVITGAITGGFQAFGTQKAEARLVGIEERLKDLENLTKLAEK